MEVPPILWEKPPFLDRDLLVDELYNEIVERVVMQPDSICEIFGL